MKIKPILLLLIIMINIIFLNGCRQNTETTIKEKSLSNDANMISTMHMDFFIQYLEIDSIKNFKLSYLHYRDGKVYQKQDLIDDDKENDEYLNIYPLISIAINPSKKDNYELYFVEQGSSAKFDITFRYSEDNKQSLNSYITNNLNFDKNLVLGGVYLSNNKNTDDDFKNIISKEAIVFYLDKTK